MYVDLREAELRRYVSAQTEPADFDDFWRMSLEESRSLGVPPTINRVDSGLTTVDVFDVTFSGFNGEPIRAWLRLPAESRSPLTCVVTFAGYTGGRGRAQENLFWSSAGFAHLHMDSRGQGSGSSVGDTPDPHGGGPHVSGFLTMGIEGPETFYYRRLLIDAVRAVDAARSIDIVNTDRIAVSGTSQGGGMALAVGALAGDLIAVNANVPFLCDFPRATVLTDRDPYKEVGTYLAIHRNREAQVHRTLSYFDGVNFAKRITAPARFSVALMDQVCPPSSVFGAINNYRGMPEVTVWRYNGHEAGGIDDDLLTRGWLQQQLEKAGRRTVAWELNL